MVEAKNLISSDEQFGRASGGMALRANGFALPDRPFTIVSSKS